VPRVHEHLDCVIHGGAEGQGFSCKAPEEVRGGKEKGERRKEEGERRKEEGGRGWEGEGEEGEDGERIPKH
jgi:hypothetical protein